MKGVEASEEAWTISQQKVIFPPQVDFSPHLQETEKKISLEFLDTGTTRFMAKLFFF